HAELVRQDHRAGHGARRFELPAQGRERHAQAVPPRVLADLGPELLDQELAGVAPPAVVGQVGEQRPGLLRPEPADDPVPLARAQPAEQLDPPRFRDHRPFTLAAFRYRHSPAYQATLTGLSTSGGLEAVGCRV